NGMSDVAPTAVSDDPPSESRAWANQDSGSLYCSGEVRILVLDDDESVCRVMQAALAPGDFKVDAVSDPALMEATLRGRQYHVIILDYCIPGLESQKVLEWVREHQADASIIVVTAYPSIDSALSCLRARTY